MSTKKTGKNTTLTFGGTLIGNIKDISGPSMQKDFIDVTDMSSPGNYREFIGGLRDPGEIQFTIHMSPSSSADLALRNNFDSDDDDIVATSINLAGTGTTLSFSSSVAGLGHNIPLEEAISMDVTLRVSGPVTVSGSLWS
jgi:predicted secreted protein